MYIGVSAPMLEAVGSTQYMLHVYQTAWRYIPQDFDLHLLFNVTLA